MKTETETETEMEMEMETEMKTETKIETKFNVHSLLSSIAAARNLSNIYSSSRSIDSRLMRQFSLVLVLGLLLDSNFEWKIMLTNR